MENRERGKVEPQQRGADPIKQAELMLAEGVGMSEWEIGTLAMARDHYSRFTIAYVTQVGFKCLLLVVYGGESGPQLIRTK